MVEQDKDNFPDDWVDKRGENVQIPLSEIQNSPLANWNGEDLKITFAPRNAPTALSDIFITQTDTGYDFSYSLVSGVASWSEVATIDKTSAAEIQSPITFNVPADFLGKNLRVVATATGILATTEESTRDYFDGSETLLEIGNAISITNETTVLNVNENSTGTFATITAESTATAPPGFTYAVNSTVDKFIMNGPYLKFTEALSYEDYSSPIEIFVTASITGDYPHTSDPKKFTLQLVDVEEPITGSLTDIPDTQYITEDSTKKVESGGALTISQNFATGDSWTIPPNIQWQRKLPTDASYTIIDGATSTTYTTVDADIDYLIQAKVSYQTVHQGAVQNVFSSEILVIPSLAITTASPLAAVDESTETTAVTAVVDSITVEGPTENRVFSLPAGESDNDLFTINTSTGAISLSDANGFNYESKDSYAIQVKVAISGTSNEATKDFTFAVNNLNDGVSLAWTTNLPETNQAALNALTVAFTATSEDVGTNYSGGSDALHTSRNWAENFHGYTTPTAVWQKSATGTGETWSNITGATGASYTPTSDDVGSYIRVQVRARTDRFGEEDEDTKLNSRVIQILPSIEFTQAAGAFTIDEFTKTIGQIDINDLGSATTKKFTTTNADVTLDESTGALSFNENVNYESPPTREVQVTVSDVTSGVTINDDGHSNNKITRTFTIAINDLNDAPVISNSFGTQEFTEDEGGDYSVTKTFTATDEDRTGLYGEGTQKDTLLWSISSGTHTYGDLTIDSQSGEWTYTLKNSDNVIQSLNEGEVETETFTIKVEDQAGGHDSETITFQVTGTNDAPTLAYAVGEDGTGSLSEGGTSASGTLVATDVDDDAQLSWGIVTSTANEFPPYGYGNLSLGTPTGDKKERVEWTYTIDNTLAMTKSLAEGEVRKERFYVRATDNHNQDSTTDMMVTITLTGTNNAPEITLGEYTGAVQEESELEVSGTITASDKDLGDTEDDSGNNNTVETATWSIVGAPAGTPQTKDGTYGTLTLSNTVVTKTDTATTSQVNWTYALNNDHEEVQRLREKDLSGSSLTDTLMVAITDKSGRSHFTDVKITIHGTNDKPEITYAQGHITGALREESNLEAMGTLSATDTDLGDTLTWYIVNTDGTLTSGPLVGSYGTLSIAQTNNDCTWTYDLDNTNETVQNLNEGSRATGTHGTISETFTLRVMDDSGRTDTDADTMAYEQQVITMTITGTNDGPTIQTASAAGAVTEDDTTQATGEITSTDIDNNATADWKIQGAAAGTPHEKVGSYGTLRLDVSNNTGSSNTIYWAYELDQTNTAVQALNVGSRATGANGTLTEAFTVTVTDDNGAFDSLTVNLTITGNNDAPTAVTIQDKRITEGDTLTFVYPDFQDKDNNHLLTYSAKIRKYADGAAEVDGYSGTGQQGTLGAGAAFENIPAENHWITFRSGHVEDHADVRTFTIEHTNDQQDFELDVFEVEVTAVDDNNASVSAVFKIIVDAIDTNQLTVNLVHSQTRGGIERLWRGDRLDLSQHALGDDADRTASNPNPDLQYQWQYKRGEGDWQNIDSYSGPNLTTSTDGVQKATAIETNSATNSFYFIGGERQEGDIIRCSITYTDKQSFRKTVNTDSITVNYVDYTENATLHDNIINEKVQHIKDTSEDELDKLLRFHRHNANPATDLVNEVRLQALFKALLADASTKDLVTMDRYYGKRTRPTSIKSDTEFKASGSTVDSGDVVLATKSGESATLQNRAASLKNDNISNAVFVQLTEDVAADGTMNFTTTRTATDSDGNVLATSTLTHTNVARGETVWHQQSDGARVSTSGVTAGSLVHNGEVLLEGAISTTTPAASGVYFSFNVTNTTGINLTLSASSDQGQLTENTSPAELRFNTGTTLSGATDEPHHVMVTYKITPTNINTTARYDKPVTVSVKLDGTDQELSFTVNVNQLITASASGDPFVTPFF